MTNAIDVQRFRPAKPPDRSVSIVIPTHNYARFLERCVNSALTQSVPPFEVIVVDDGSTDKTAQVLGSFSSPVRPVWIPHSGPAAARNAGIRAASGEFVAFLDADDVMLRARLEQQLTAATRADLVIANVWVRRAESRRLFHANPVDMSAFHDGLLMHQVEVFTASLFARRSLLLHVGGYDERLAASEGLDLLLRLSHEARAGYVHEPLMERNLHQDNYSEHLGTDLYLRERLKIIERHLREGAHGPGVYRRKARANVYRRVGGWYRARKRLARALFCELQAARIHPEGIRTRGGLMP